MTQIEKITKHLNTTGSISGVEAAALYGVRALPRRISDIEAKGILRIKRVRKVAVNGQRYVRYVKVVEV